MKVVDVDIDVNKDMIPKLRQEGHIVVCYFSVGTAEPWREDVKRNLTYWKKAAVHEMRDWNEWWLDFKNKFDLVTSLQAPRFYRAKQEGCHAIEPDNIDCYDNRDCWAKMHNPPAHGSDLIPTQLKYNMWQVNLAHSLGLSIAMKNAVEIIDQSHKAYDFAINEQCQTYEECSGYSKFFAENKGVFHVEYDEAHNWCTHHCGSLCNKLKIKYCNGDNNQGLCHHGSTWQDCFKPTVPLPPTHWNNGSITH
eukprot:TRINITY_DN67757_c3_g9_i1.p1 TRINITY_DN67757_c3_g9~~TRINITY_DN67757_c3_g9_i1.p1  ORF type:complete len:292 (+),score=38.05 TRINITY_DN67757_c3_g9_i1:129-878(+)